MPCSGYGKHLLPMKKRDNSLRQMLCALFGLVVDQGFFCSLAGNRLCWAATDTRFRGL